MAAYGKPALKQRTTVILRAINYSLLGYLQREKITFNARNM